MKTALLAGAIIASTASVACAATYTYDFNAPSAFALQQTYTPSANPPGSPAGPDLTVTPQTSDGTTTQNVTGSNRGIKAYTGGIGQTSYRYDEHTVDGNGLSDILLLTFAGPVKLLSISFGYAGLGYDGAVDQFDLYRGGTQVLNQQDIGANASGNGTVNLSLADIYSSTWAIAASAFQVTVCTRYWPNGTCKRSTTKSYFDSFKLLSLNVELQPPRDTTPPVPVPAALPLMASGLGALGFMAWRKRRKTTGA